MATHDYVIANGTGAAVRSDLNNALAAIVSNNSSSSEPTTKYAYQWWADTTTGQLKLRNAANNGWVTIAELDGTMLLEDGTVSAPGLAFASDLNSGLFSGGADKINFATGGAERLEIGSSEVVFNDDSNDVDFRVESNGQTHMLFVDAGNDRVGIGAEPGTFVEIDSTAPYVTIKNNTHEDTSGGRESKVIFEGEQSGGEITSLAEIEVSHEGTADDQKGQLILKVNSGAEGASPGEAVRIDSSGRLLAGVSSTSSQTRAIFEGNSGGGTGGGDIVLARNAATPSTNEALGLVGFSDNTHVVSSSIQCFNDGGTWSGSSKPTRMTFSTTENGSTTNTERMRLTKDGHLFINQTSNSTPGYSSGGTNMGGSFENLGTGGTALFLSRTGNFVASFNRAEDGTIVQFASAGTSEGNINISGTTCSYNGAHLSRWSQLAGGVERIEILRGSVLSNIDEMCEWAYDAQDAVLYTEEDELPEGVSVGDVKTPARDAGTEDNEQLNRMKVSDTEGDKNVSGVFQAWDDDDDTYLNDFYCAMTGDFIIRIAQGTTVARGDLLMSAGDGTAKPQDDDIVRSKTIAKVTSTTVSTTYSDNSYCVPCVLMTC